MLTVAPLDHRSAAACRDNITGPSRAHSALAHNCGGTEIGVPGGRICARLYRNVSDALISCKIAGESDNSYRLRMCDRTDPTVSGWEDSRVEYVTLSIRSFSEQSPIVRGVPP